MSNFRMVDINCPRCDSIGTFKLWDSINSMVNPELVDVILKKELYHWDCPVCGEKCDIIYAFLFHYMEELRFIAVGCDYSDAIEDFGGLPDGYIYNQVGDIEGLIELLLEKKADN